METSSSASGSGCKDEDKDSEIPITIVNVLWGVGIAVALWIRKTCRNSLIFTKNLTTLCYHPHLSVHNSPADNPLRPPKNALPLSSEFQTENHIFRLNTCIKEKNTCVGYVVVPLLQRHFQFRVVVGVSTTDIGVCSLLRSSATFLLKP
ncbi:hypothetical protein L2E82_49345 [Cichorium intybus]|uniref:Uncharacterized protein n=1 Tax=Cichorium intybus TaxID=13427 RepID=A0ACB8Z021_CICIN|nr:hypothetical protein L2E82_49345 [Cichorium intybus]